MDIEFNGKVVATCDTFDACIDKIGELNEGKHWITRSQVPLPNGDMLIRVNNHEGVDYYTIKTSTAR